MPLRSTFSSYARKAMNCCVKEDEDPGTSTPNARQSPNENAAEGRAQPARNRGRRIGAERSTSQRLLSSLSNQSRRHTGEEATQSPLNELGSARSKRVASALRRRTSEDRISVASEYKVSARSSPQQSRLDAGGETRTDTAPQSSLHIGGEHTGTSQRADLASRKSHERRVRVRLGEELKLAQTKRLFDAVEKGDLAKLVNVLDSIAGNPATLEKDGETAFLYAANRDQHAAMQVMLKHPDFDPNAHAQTGVAFWIEHNRPDIGRILLNSEHIGTDGASADGRTLLHKAAAANASTEWVALLAQSCGIDTQDKGGNAPIHLATSVAMIEALLEQGATGNASNANGDAPLHLAIKRGDTDAVQCLCSRGAMSQFPGHDRLKPLSLAAAVADVRMIRTLSTEISVRDDAQNGDGLQALGFAFPRQQPELVEALFDLGVGNHEGGANKVLALHLIASNAPAYIALALTRCAHQVNAQDFRGHTPLHDASSHGHVSVVKALIEAGAAYDTLSARGQTALGLALGNRNHEIVRLLAFSGADINANFNLEQMVMRSALQARDEELVRFLLPKMTVKPNPTQFLGIANDLVFAGIEEGRPHAGVLVQAILRGSIEMFSALVARNVDVNAVDPESKLTPLTCAIGRRQFDVLDKILPMADVNQADGRDILPMACAIENGDYATALKLYQGGARINEMSKSGFLSGKHSLTSLAQRLKQADIARLFVSQEPIPKIVLDGRFIPGITHEDLPPLDPVLYINHRFELGRSMFSRSGRGEMKRTQTFPAEEFDSDDETALLKRQEKALLADPVDAVHFQHNAHNHAISLLPSDQWARFSRHVEQFSVPLAAGNSTRLIFRGIKAPPELGEKLRLTAEQGTQEEKARQAFDLLHPASEKTSMHGRHHGASGASTRREVIEDFVVPLTSSEADFVGMEITIAVRGGEKAARGATARDFYGKPESEVLLDPSNSYVLENVIWNEKTSRWLVSITAENSTTMSVADQKPPLLASTVFGKKLADVSDAQDPLRRDFRFEGKDDLIRDVSIFADSSRATAAVLFDRLVADMQLTAPKSQNFYYYVEAPAYGRETMTQLKTFDAQNPEHARAFFDAFVIDVITMNWNAPGDHFQHLAVTATGEVVRTDASYAFDFNGASKHKADTHLNDLRDLEHFFDPDINPSYAALARCAGLAKPEDVPGIKKQIEKLAQLRNDHQGFGRYVSRAIPMGHPHRTHDIARALSQRLGALEKCFGMERYHGQLNEVGQPHYIEQPTVPTDPSTWDASDKIAVFTPPMTGQAREEIAMPSEINGVALRSWVPPSQASGWNRVDGKLSEPEPIPHPDIKRTGTIIMEPDGRVWMMEPSNHFSGENINFPKGKVERGLSYQASAIKETFEETGLKVELTKLLKDVDDTRYYLAKRVAGTPLDAGWEAQGVWLVPMSELNAVVNPKPRSGKPQTEEPILGPLRAYQYGIAQAVLEHSATSQSSKSAALDEGDRGVSLTS